MKTKITDNLDKFVNIEKIQEIVRLINDKFIQFDLPPLLNTDLFIASVENDKKNLKVYNYILESYDSNEKNEIEPLFDDVNKLNNELKKVTPVNQWIDLKIRYKQVEQVRIMLEKRVPDIEKSILNTFIYDILSDNLECFTASFDQTIDDTLSRNVFFEDLKIKLREEYRKLNEPSRYSLEDVLEATCDSTFKSDANSLHVYWSIQGCGFGHLYFKKENDIVYCDNERMKRSDVILILTKLADSVHYTNKENKVIKTLADIEIESIVENEDTENEKIIMTCHNTSKENLTMFLVKMVKLIENQHFG